MFIRNSSFLSEGARPKHIHPSARSRVPDVNDASGIAHQPPLDLWLSPEQVNSRGRDRKAEFTIKEEDEMKFSAVTPPSQLPYPPNREVCYLLCHFKYH